MKIDMSKATTAWLEAFKAKKLASPQGSFYNRIEITHGVRIGAFDKDRFEVPHTAAHLPQLLCRSCIPAEQDCAAVVLNDKTKRRNRMVDGNRSDRDVRKVIRLVQD